MTVTLCPRARQVALGRFDPYSIGPYPLGEANDVFNSVEVVASCRPATLHAYPARHRVVGSLDTIVALLHRAVEPPCTVATRREWAAGRHYTVAVMQPPVHTSC
jgi:hypothetical protein